MAVGRKLLHTQQRATTSRLRRNNPGNKGSPVDARLKLQRNSIKIRKSEGDQVTLYTSHFDARKKITAKKTTVHSRSNNGKNAQKGQNNGAREGGIYKARANLKSNIRANVRANNGVASGSGNIRTANSRGKNEPISPRKNTNNVRNGNLKTGVRDTTFTGKSLQISTTNELAKRERKSSMQGKSLSVTARNRPTSGKKSPPSKEIQKTIGNNSKWIGPSNKQLSPEPPILTPSSQKSLPAKVVISNLHPNVTQEDILELFGAIGPVREGRVKNIGTAEVVYRLAEDAFAAYSKYHGRNLDGQPMILKITTVEESGHRMSSGESSGLFSSSSRGSGNSKYSNTTASSSSSHYSSASSTNVSTKPVVFTVKL